MQQLRAVRRGWGVGCLTKKLSQTITLDRVTGLVDEGNLTDIMNQNLKKSVSRHSSLETSFQAEKHPLESAFLGTITQPMVSPSYSSFIQS